jgi:enamine deaminase RidA (YjgF/YER057c/UK114 family)
MSGDTSSRRIFNPEVLPEIANRFSQAMQYGPLVFLAGMIASDFSHGIVPDVIPPAGLPYDRNPTHEQAEFVLRRQQRVAQAASSGLDRAAQTWTFMTDITRQADMQRARRAVFGLAMPAATTMGVERLTVAGGLIEIDAILAAPGAERAVIAGGDLPPVPTELGMAHAVRVGPFVFVSSLAAPQVASSGAFPFFASTVKLQTADILRQLQAILEHVGVGLGAVVKVQVTLPDLADFAEFEEVWQEAFPKNPPARTIIPARLGIPGCRIEINAIATDGSIPHQTIHTDRAPTPIIHEPQAVQAGPFTFLSQMMATDFRHGLAPEARVNPQFPNHDSPIRRQLAYIFANADAVLEAAGSSLKTLVRRQGFYSTFQGNLAPARDVTLATFASMPSPSTHVSLGTKLLIPGCDYLFDAIGVPT